MTAPDASRPAFRPRLSLLGWALNEEENIAEYVRRAEIFLREHSDDFELILIDDGSTDATWTLVCALQAGRPWLRPCQNDRNRGSGYCYRRAIQAATKDFFLAQTVDWSYDITRLGQSLDLLGSFDIVQGVRADTLSPGGLFRRSDNPAKALVSIVNYTLIRALFRLPLRDYQNVTVCPARLMRTVVLEADSSFANPEVLLKAWWQGASFVEVPVPFLKRQRGRGAGTRWRFVVRSVSEILYYWLRWVILARRDHYGRGSVTRLEVLERRAPA